MSPKKRFHTTLTAKQERLELRQRQWWAGPPLDQGYGPLFKPKPHFRTPKWTSEVSLDLFVLPSVITLHSLLFTITGLFNWPTEDWWPSLACEGCQGPASVPSRPWKDLAQLEQIEAERPSALSASP